MTVESNGQDRVEREATRTAGNTSHFSIPLSWVTIAVLLIFAFGIWIRFHDLGKMAYHHDESIHAYYSWRLYDKGPYSPEIRNDPSRYDPTYHGPFLYHVGALTFFLFGDNDFTGRLPFAVSGVIVMWFAFQFRRYLGEKTGILLLLLVSISPILTYFARFARNDTYNAMQCIGMIYCGIQYFRETDFKRKSRWLWGLSFFLILHYCTKENSYAHGAIYCSFLGFYFIWRLIGAWRKNQEAFSRLMHQVFVEHNAFTRLYSLYGWFSIFMYSYVYLDIYAPKKDVYTQGLLQPLAMRLMPDFIEKPLGGFWVGWGKWFIWWIPAFLFLFGMMHLIRYLRLKYSEEHEKQTSPWDLSDTGGILARFPVLVSISIILIIYCTLFSTLFSNTGIRTGDGLRDGIYRYLSYWIDMHHHPRIPGPFWYYLPRLALYETLGFLTWGIALIVYTVWAWIDYKNGRQRKDFYYPFRFFLIYYAFTSIAIYSQLQEKVPWLGVHQALPLILLAGTFYGDLWERLQSRSLKVIIGAIFVCLAIWSLRGNILVNCFNNDNPKEIMVYTQSDANVTKMMREIEQIAFQSTQGLAMPIAVQGNAQWPFSWYLRNYAMRPGTVTRPLAPVILADESEAMRMKAMLGDKYTVRTYDFRSHWSPNLTAPPDGLLLPQNSGKFRKRIWDYIIYRRIWSPAGSFRINLYVLKDLIPSVMPPDVELPSGSEQRPQRPNFLRSFGRSGSATGAFMNPRGIAVSPAGEVYVVDSKNARIQKFDAEGQFLLTWGSPGGGPGELNPEFTGPCGIAIGPDGSVYVADTWNHRIQKFDPNGRFLKAWRGATSDFFGPRALAVDQQGNVYVVDTGNKRIQKFDSEGTFIRQWGRAGALRSEFDEPVGIAVGGDGMIYVADTGNKRIQVFDLDGRFQREIFLLAWEHEIVSAVEPNIAVDAEGRIYVTDTTVPAVIQLTRDGRSVLSWGVKGSGPGQFEEPTGIAIGPDGNVYVTDRRQHRVSVFQPK